MGQQPFDKKPNAACCGCARIELFANLRPTHLFRRAEGRLHLARVSRAWIF
jgi:hypothetical protein